MKNKLLTLLGFAAKSGNISYGMAKARESLAKGKARLAVSAADVSEKSRKENAHTVIELCFLAELENAVGYKWSCDGHGECICSKCSQSAVGEKECLK